MLSKESLSSFSELLESNLWDSSLFDWLGILFSNHICKQRALKANDSYIGQYSSDIFDINILGLGSVSVVEVQISHCLYQILFCYCYIINHCFFSVMTG
jgi:hypothetical protein